MEQKNKKNINKKIGERPTYMEQLFRKECNTIIKKQSLDASCENEPESTIQRKTKQCIFCKETPGRQEHILDQCKKAPRAEARTSYQEVFNDNNLKKQLSNDYIDRKLQIKLNNDLAKQVLNFQNINRKPIKQGKQKIQ